MVSARVPFSKGFRVKQGDGGLQSSCRRKVVQIKAL